MAEARPVIAIDTREQLPLGPFTRLQTVRGTLNAGDYSVAGLEHLFSVERKSIPDLAGCITGSNRDRFERELWRLQPYEFRRLLIIGASDDSGILNFPYQSRINPRAVLASLYAWQARFGIPFVLAPSPAVGARLVELWAIYWAREKCHEANGLLRGYWRSAKARVPAVGIY